MSFGAALVRFPPDLEPVVEIPTRTHIAEDLVANMPSPPKNGYRRTLASYSPSMDTVSIPSPEWFTSGAEFYGALMHELAHSTGHESRVGRHRSSQEELVAEMTAAFLCAIQVSCCALKRIRRHTCGAG